MCWSQIGQIRWCDEADPARTTAELTHCRTGRYRIIDQHPVALIGPQGGQETQFSPQRPRSMRRRELHHISGQSNVVLRVEYMQFQTHLFVCLYSDAKLRQNPFIAKYPATYFPNHYRQTILLSPISAARLTAKSPSINNTLPYRLHHPLWLFSSSSSSNANITSRPATS